MENYRSVIIITPVIFIILIACDMIPESNPVKTTRTSDVTVMLSQDFEKVTIAKWFDNHTAAISLNYDSGGMVSENDLAVQSLVREYGLSLDYELVTAELWDWKLNHILAGMVPNGITFFGHGHHHIDHDELSYADAYDSFRQCY